MRGEAIAWSRLEGGVDPSTFLQRCEHHGVAALVYHQASEQTEWRDWPQEVREGLFESSKAGIAQDMLRTHYLDELLDEFERNQVACLLTKGEALALLHYDKPGTRSRCDTDLFIPAREIEKVRSIASGLGLETVSTVYKTHQFTLRRKHKSPGLIQFDVHWRIQNAPRYARLFSFEEAFSKASNLPGRSSTRTLQAADALMLACVHRAGSDRHDQDRLIWIYDIHLLANSMKSAQFAAFTEKAVSSNIQRVCLDGLNKAAECLGTVIPDSVMNGLATPEMDYTIARRYRESNLALLVDDCKQLPDTRSRIRLLRELFLPESKSLLRKYGKADRWWLPVLYLRNFLSGLTNRFMLK